MGVVSEFVDLTILYSLQLQLLTSCAWSCEMCVGVVEVVWRAEEQAEGQVLSMLCC